MVTRRKGRGKRGDGGNDGGEPQGPGKNHGGEQQGPGKHHGGDPVRIHEDYVRRHLGGGAPATIGAYERAAKQFQKLPGAVRRPSVDVTPAPSEPSEDEKPEKRPDNEREKP